MPAPVHQVQITRAVKAVKNAGVSVERVEVAPDGTVSVFTGDGKDIVRSAGEVASDDDPSIEDWV